MHTARFHVITIRGCKFCKFATEFLTKKNFDFSEQVVNKITFSNSNDKPKNWNGTFPVVYEYDKYIGGYNDLRDYILRNRI